MNYKIPLKNHSISLLGILLMLWINNACTNSPQHTITFKADSLYAKILCKADTNQSYALYLPKNFQAKQPAILLVLFDSHGNGKYPLTLWRKVASNYNIIIAASNNSKNGLSIQQTLEIGETLLHDVQSKFNIYPKGIYIGGFSGGARVAHSLASHKNNIAGVISVGAGLANKEQFNMLKYSVLLIGGNRDFNLSELQLLNQALEQNNINHHLLIFNGKHEWLSNPEDITKIFEWINLDAMKQQILPLERNYINQFIEKYDQQTTASANNGNLYEQYDSYIMMSHYLQGLNDIQLLKDECNKLINSPEVSRIMQLQQELSQQEQNLFQQYTQALQKEPLNYWKTESAKLQTLSKQETNTLTADMYNRVLGHLSLSCYMYASTFLKEKNVSAASHFVTIYSWVDPQNPEHYYMAAQIAMMNSHVEETLKQLENAQQLGFSDKERLLSDPLFKTLHQNSRFKDLLK